MRLSKHAAPLAAALALVLGCASDFESDSSIPAPPSAGEPDPGNTAGGEDNTFDHMSTQVDVWKIIERLQAEGPLKYSARVHACGKMRYRTFGQFLQSRGVDLSAETGGAAGELYRSSQQSLGGPNYAARTREAAAHTSASAQRMFDILIVAAPEIIAGMPTAEACMVNGEPTPMFDDAGNCTANGVACLIGVMPTASHLEICNQTIAQASSPEKGREIAVAALAAAAHTCE